MFNLIHFKMKKLKSIIAILAIALATTFSANATEKEPETVNSKLRAEVVKHLGDKLPFVVKDDCKAKVSFMLNNNNEIIVIDVDTKVTAFNNYVKNKLNYKKIKTSGLEKGEIYKIPVKLNSAR